jgi:hypothetical protein
MNYCKKVTKIANRETFGSRALPVLGVELVAIFCIPK